MNVKNVTRGLIGVLLFTITLAVSDEVQQDTRIDTGLYHKCNPRFRLSPECHQEELIGLRKQVASLRQQLGNLSCSCKGTGPAGGFCHTPGGSSYKYSTDKGIAEELGKLFKGSTVLDLGCGVGHYGKLLREAGAEWTGYDGAENVEAATNGLVKWADLSTPQWFGRTFTWVMSLEVGEHLPKKYEKVYIDNIVRHAQHGVVVSWAVPGQGGLNHVNNQPPEYIIKQFAKRGYALDQASTAHLRSVASDSPWFKKTIMVFRKRQGMRLPV